MNLKAKKVFYLSLIVFFLVTIVTSIYYLLGGFKEVEVYQLGPVDRTVFGKFFDDPRSDAYYEHGVLCRKLIEEQQISGTLAVIFFLNDSSDQREFIGISIEEEIAEVPEGFEPLDFSSDQRFAIFLDMHPLVQPRPKKVEELLQDKAEEAGYELEDFYFTLIYPDNSRSVEWWVK